MGEAEERLGSESHRRPPNLDDPATWADPDNWEAVFGEELSTARPRRTTVLARLLAVIAVTAMIGGSIGVLTNAILDRADFDDPVETRAAAIGHAEQNRWGWLVSEIRIAPIEAPRVGAFVTNNPPDGIITIDDRPWNDDRLRELVDHEIGHLLDFARWRPFDPDRRGGLGGEVWAECAAVFAGSRGVDGARADERYHCRSEDLAIFESEVAQLGDLCKRWGDRRCRPG